MRVLTGARYIFQVSSLYVGFQRIIMRRYGCRRWKDGDHVVIASSTDDTGMLKVARAADATTTMEFQSHKIILNNISDVYKIFQFSSLRANTMSPYLPAHCPYAYYDCLRACVCIISKTMRRLLTMPSRHNRVQHVLFVRPCVCVCVKKIAGFF